MRYPELEETLPEELRQLFWVGVGIFICLGLFIILFVLLFNARKNRLLREKLQMESAFEQVLLQTRVEIQEETLKNVSHEIHDNVGQVLSLAKLHLNSMHLVTTAHTPDKIEAAIELVSKAISDLRTLSRTINGNNILGKGFDVSVAALVESLNHLDNMSGIYLLEGKPVKLDPKKELVLFRIVQEAINNAVKHSKAKHITAHLSYAGSICKLCVEDDGLGFDPASPALVNLSSGLINMEERAKMIGASFKLTSIVNSGTSIIIQIPTS